MQNSLHSQYLEAMGIEVWYSKPEKTELAEAGVSQHESTAIVSTASVSRESVPSESRICLLQYRHCLILLELPAALQELPGNYQSLLDDIAFSIGASNESKLFSQDQSDTDDADPYQSMHRQIEQLIGDSNACLIVMGDLPRRLLFGDQVKTMQSTSFLGRAAITAMGIEQLLEQPIHKRALWQELQSISSDSE